MIAYAALHSDFLLANNLFHELAFFYIILTIMYFIFIHLFFASSITIIITIHLFFMHHFIKPFFTCVHLMAHRKLLETSSPITK